MNTFSFSSQHFGALCVALVLMNSALWWLLAQRDWQKDPSRREGEQKLLAGFTAALSLPFLIMEAGTGLQEKFTVWHFFRPQDGNAFVLLYFGYWFAFAFGLAIWAWFFGGAGFIARNARVFRWFRLTGPPVPWQPDERFIKALALGLPVFYALATAALVTMDAPVDDITTLTAPGAPPRSSP